MNKNINYKFNEEFYLNQLKQYVDSTYDKHYASGKIQSLEKIIDNKRGTGFLMGNIQKYSDRYGIKGDIQDHRADLLKILHYALMQLFVHDIENVIWKHVRFKDIAFDEPYSPDFNEYRNKVFLVEAIHPDDLTGTKVKLSCIDDHTVNVKGYIDFNLLEKVELEDK